MPRNSRYDVGVIRDLYRRGVNISAWIRSQDGVESNSLTSILYSYDIQAGSYSRMLGNPAVCANKAAVGAKLAEILDGLSVKTLLDAGVGEATTLAPILGSMQKRPQTVFGCDISLSRLLFAKRHLDGNGLDEVRLFTASLDDVPLADGAVDAVVTVHAIEPNGGREAQVLAELMRVARRYVVMVEPSFELGNEDTQARISQHGYIKGLPAHAENLGGRVVRHELWGLDGNPTNQAALIIVEVPSDNTVGEGFISPISRQRLTLMPDAWFCVEDGHAFPVIQGISCLMPENAILASHLGEFVVGQ